MEADTQNMLLLYWSGEADESQSLEVEALLETDAEARLYLDELGELDALGGGLAELPASTPSRAFAAEAVAGHLAETKATRISFVQIGAVAAAMFVLVAIGLKLLPSSDASRDKLANEELPTADAPVAGSSMPRPKLSERLFVAREFVPKPTRISAARERVRQLRTGLRDQPTSRL
jgi:anti-sigma factor RsiW